MPTERATRQDGREETIAEFEQRALDFLRANIPPLSEVHPDDAVGEPRGEESIVREKALQAKIFDAGFAALTYPVESGGQGLGEAEDLVWQRLIGEYAVPRTAFSVSHGMCGPTLNALGTPEQRKKYLPDLWRGDTIFAQMFSEPGAGSDVASLQTRAEKVESGWRITGQKVWTTNAQFCDYGLLIARTNPDVPKHQGLTMFIVDLRDPAVTVRPLRVANGDYPFNEIFIDGLFVPDEDVLGDVDKGWSATLTMLSFERITLGTGSTKTVGTLAFENLLAVAQESGLTAEPATRAALAEAYVLEQGFETLALRMREEVEAGADLGERGSIAKLAASIVYERLIEILSDLQGLPLVAWHQGDDFYPSTTRAVVSGPGIWFGGGTQEIQKNIIGERILKLDREPSLDRGVPFRDIRRGR